MRFLKLFGTARPKYELVKDYADSEASRNGGRSRARPSYTLWEVCHRQHWRFWFATALGGTTLISIAIVIGWLLFERQATIEVYKATCSPPPGPYLAWQPRFASAYFTSEDYYLDSNSTTLRKTRGKRIGIFQVCTVPRRDSWYLATLLDNHRQYCAEHGYEYAVATGAEARGVWEKVIGLRDKLEAELERPAGERLQWLFYTDVDTVIINRLVSLESFLPSSPLNPFLLAAKDGNGLNAGSFFLKIDARSVRFLKTVLEYRYSSVSLRFLEQSAMRLIIEERKLERKGEVVFLPQGFFNSYGGEQAPRNNTASFQLHYPSLGRKRHGLLPLLRDLRDGEISFGKKSSLEERQRKLLAIIRSFWQSRKGAMPKI